MLVPLNGSPWLAPHPNDKEACFDVDLDKLEGDALLIRHEWQVAFTAMKRERRPASDHDRIAYDNSLNGIIAGDG
jgi:hypothetical protein